jgi:hypothetical protein
MLMKAIERLTTKKHSILLLIEAMDEAEQLVAQEEIRRIDIRLKILWSEIEQREERANEIDPEIRKYYE